MFWKINYISTWVISILDWPRNCFLYFERVNMPCWTQSFAFFTSFYCWSLIAVKDVPPFFESFGVFSGVTFSGDGLESRYESTRFLTGFWDDKKRYFVLTQFLF